MSEKKKYIPSKTFSFQGFDNMHYRITEQYVDAVDALFGRATMEISLAALQGKYNPNKPFSFVDYPRTHAKAQQIIDNLASNINSVVNMGSTNQWVYACKKNDAFLASIIDTSKVAKAQLEAMQDRNLDALQTFQKRKVDGMDLSQRVWKYVDQYKDQIELGLDVGLGDGRSAQQLSRDLKENLQDPDRLFRRVRNKRGNLQLSKAAKAFHPGQGVYRSSSKNAARVTRSEINMSYRESDWLRWQGLEFVVGFNVQRSNREPRFKCKLCDGLVGRYPKSFKFKGWHPQCMCFATAILMDMDEFDKNELSDLKAALRGKEYKKLESRNIIKDMPQGFKDFVTENVSKQENWKSTPYFIRDNFKDGLLLNGLKFITSQQKLPTPKLIVPLVVKEIIKPPIEVVEKSTNFPTELKVGGDYLRGEDYEFDKDFFNLIDPKRPIKLEIVTRQDGAYYSAGKVHLCNASRNKASSWYKKAVVYHEYGHAIDWQRDLRKTNELAEIRKKQIANLKKQSKYTIWERKMNTETWQYENVKVVKTMSKVAYIDGKLTSIMKRIFQMKDSTFTNRGITKMDVLEQIGSTRDTIKSLVVSYGDGHSTKYFRTPGFKEAEYLAHAFENTFLGNQVFKKYMPDVYNEMIDYIRTLDKF